MSGSSLRRQDLPARADEERDQKTDRRPIANRDKIVWVVTGRPGQLPARTRRTPVGEPGRLPRRQP